MVAILPAAGLGTRMAKLTGGTPKELVTLGRHSVLERVIDEAIVAGADEIVVVSSRSKPQIEEQIAEWRKGRFREANLRVAYQDKPCGLSDAILSAQVTDDALVMLADSVIFGNSPSPRMANLLEIGLAGCIAVEMVSDAEVHRYGMCEVDDVGTIRRIVEKPQPSQIVSRWAVAARYAFSAAVMSALPHWLAEEAATREPGEIPLTPLLIRAIADGAELKAVALQPDQKRVDCGTPEEYEAARRLNWD